MPLLSHVALLCLFLFLVVLVPAPGQGAVALNHHQLKMHVEWNRAVEREDWTDWNAAFAMADLGDGNSHGHVHEVAKVFKEHFNIIHGRMEHNHAGLTRAEENHFKDDAAHFVEFTGRSQFIEFEAFREHMTRFMEHKSEERQGLLDVAQHIL